MRLSDNNGITLLDLASLILLKLNIFLLSVSVVPSRSVATSMLVPIVAFINIAITHAATDIALLAEA